MKETDEQSAELKHRLRTLPETAALAQEAEEFPAEAEEALIETEDGRIPALTGSWVANKLGK